MGIRKSKIYIKISHFVEKCGNFFMKHRIVLNIPGVLFVGEKVQKKKTKKSRENQVIARGLINEQRLYENVKYGLGNVSYSGCELVAIYNASLLTKTGFDKMGADRINADASMKRLIQSALKKKYTMLNGKWGTNPYDLGRLLEENNLKYEVIKKQEDIISAEDEGIRGQIGEKLQSEEEKHSKEKPQLEEEKHSKEKLHSEGKTEKSLYKNTGVYVVSFWNRGDDFMGGVHTVAIALKKDEKESLKIKAYNDYRAETRSIEEFFANRRFIIAYKILGKMPVKF
jgi:uncharacterized membrane protein YfhO